MTMLVDHVVSEAQDEVLLPPYQFGFINSEARYPALVSAIGTGKTYMALLKVWRFCSDYPDQLALVVRKEYTDLRDSTMNDFERYFGVKIGSDRNYDFGNGSRIMFRHGEEMQAGKDTPNVLKNINLSMFLIEQAEEFLTDKVFTFLRDRLRRSNAPYRQGIIIGNVCGHNWIYKNWKINPTDDKRYELYEATTFDNARNLPQDFIDDLKSMENDAPAHYRRYVLNDWDEEEGVDILIHRRIVEASWSVLGEATGGKMLIVDPARSNKTGSAETAIDIVQRIDEKRFAQTHQEAHRGWDTMMTVGRLCQIVLDGEIEVMVIDANGLGGGVYDRIMELKESAGPELKEKLKLVSVIGYNGGQREGLRQPEKYVNFRAEHTWMLKDNLTNGFFRLLQDEKATNQLTSLQFGYRSNGQRFVLSKEEMAAKGLESPDRADTKIMAQPYLQQLSAAKMLLTPKAQETREFWDRVKADIAKNSDDGAGWHVVD